MNIRTAAGAAFAVCAAIVIGIVIYYTYGGDETENTDGIRQFNSYSQIQKVLGEIKEENPIVYAMGGEPVVEEDLAVKDAEHSDTYIQVEGVDEADIIKTDGKYIYYTSRLGYDVIIAKVTDGRTEESAVLSEEELGLSAENLFLTGNRLVIMGNEYQEEVGYYDPGYTTVTAVCVYDVTDPEKPELIGKYRQSGNYVSARITDGYLYLITNDYLSSEEQRIVPLAGVDENYDKLPADHVFCFPKPYSKSYAVIGSVKTDSEKGKLKTKTKAVLGSSDNIYCSGSAIYLPDYKVDYRNFTEQGADERTWIMKAEISSGEIDFAAQGSVRGWINDQFSMDEKDGYFRVAATAYVKGKDVNYLYILDENLKTVGKVKGFAAGEQIKAVRFMGDTAYVITYEQTDPLFVIDLRDPAAPEMLGSVKITGFSSLLVPAGENMLIGIGTATSEEEIGEVEDGVKIALFDISDPKSPKVLDSIEYKGWSSDVQYNHKALTVNREAGWYAIPYFSWETEEGGVLQFRVNGQALEEMEKYETEQGIERCMFIDEHIYGLGSEEDEIISWKMAH
ncbi:MAG: beta-propeller domain-containing protein [Clostridia bacterium]|nr:beta-propeller domain-containing protein [Clostridia bacterium]